MRTAIFMLCLSVVLGGCVVKTQKKLVGNMFDVESLKVYRVSPAEIGDKSYKARTPEVVSSTEILAVFSRATFEQVEKGGGRLGKFDGITFVAR